MKISVSRTLFATDEAAWGWIEMLQFGDRSPFALRLPKEGLCMLKTFVLEPKAASIVMFNQAGVFPLLQFKRNQAQGAKYKIRNLHALPGLGKQCWIAQGSFVTVVAHL
jgi:hypothetical protein